MKQISRSLMLCTFVLLSAPTHATMQDAAEATEAAREAQQAATKAALTGTAEGLYRGCKASLELRTGRPSEPDLVLALDLAGECEAFSHGVAAVAGLFQSLTLADNCRISGPIESSAFIGAVVRVVQSNPLLIGQTTTRDSLTFHALRSLAHCSGPEG
ncbi:hypothetical protein FHR55_001365 [Xanthomonas arboricola]